MVICVKEILVDDIPQSFVHMGSRSVIYADLRHYLRNQMALPESDERLVVMDRLLEILNEFPDNGIVGIAARIYLAYGVLTIGFTDHQGIWDPVINYVFSDIKRSTAQDIRNEVMKEFLGPPD